MNSITEFTIKPNLPIGTELWLMFNNKPTLVIISAIEVYISALTEENIGILQIWMRWLNKKDLKEAWKYSYNYKAIIDTWYGMHNVYENRGKYYVVDRQLFLTKEELLKNI